MSVSTYVALLRAVNVGSRNRVQMAALRALCDDLGYSDVVTYIQSGNVVLRSPVRSAAAVERALTRAIQKELGLAITVIARSKDDVAKVVSNNPFPKAEPNRLHVAFLDAKPAATRVRALETFDAGRDEVEVRGREAYLHTPQGYGVSKLSGAFVETQLRVVATARNWNTVVKLLDLASGP
jgi:uncharacterized protein (DUF1697 family)